MNKFVCIFFILSFLISCEAKKASPNIEITTKVPNHFQLYKTSEMATVMRTMYASNQKIKNHILNGEEIGDFNEAFLKIHTAKLTDSSAFDETYPTYAKYFVALQKELFTVTKEQRKQQFNSIVDACISCHKGRCNGPIPKIEKLRIH